MVITTKFVIKCMEKLEFVNSKKQTVIDAILNFKPTLNYSMVKTALRKKDVRLNGKKIDENVSVDSGTTITVFLNEKKVKKIETVFEDNNILIAKKPFGVEVTKHDKSFLDSESLEELVGYEACHRLDKNTEGIVIFAKNQTSKDILIEAFKKHKIQKNYYALCFGKIDKNGQIFENYIKKEEKYAKICEKYDKNCKIAKLSYKFVVGKNGLALLDINLETGRMHQIRAQLAYHGIYVLGDEKYGKKDVNKKYHKTKQQLCAYKIKFLNMPKPLEYLSSKRFEIQPSFNIDEYEKISH